MSYAEWPNHPFDSSGTVIASRFQASPTLIWAMLSTFLCCIYAVAQLAIWAGRSFADIQVHRCWTTDQNLRLGQVGHPEASGARPAGQTIKPHHPWMLPPGTRTQYDGVLSSSHSATGSTVKAGEDALSLWLLPLMRRFQISGESSSLRVWGLGPALVSRPTSHCPGNRCDEETLATKISAASETRFITSPWNVVRVPAKPLPEGCNLHL